MRPTPTSFYSSDKPTARFYEDVQNKTIDIHNNTINDTLSSLSSSSSHRVPKCDDYNKRNIQQQDKKRISSNIHHQESSHNFPLPQITIPSFCHRSKQPAHCFLKAYAANMYHADVSHKRCTYDSSFNQLHRSKKPYTVHHQSHTISRNVNANVDEVHYGFHGKTNRHHTASAHEYGHSRPHQMQHRPDHTYAYMPSTVHMSNTPPHCLDYMHRSLCNVSQIHPHYVQSSNVNLHHDISSPSCHIPALVRGHTGMFVGSQHDTHDYERSSRYPYTRQGQGADRGVSQGQDALRMYGPDYSAHHLMSKDSHATIATASAAAVADHVYHAECRNVEPTSPMSVTCSKAKEHEIKPEENIIPSVSYEKSPFAADAIGQNSDVCSTYSCIGSIASNFWQQHETSPSSSLLSLPQSQSQTQLTALDTKDFTSLPHVLTDDQSHRQPSQFKHDISSSSSISHVQSLSKKRIRRPCSVVGCTNRVVQGGVCIRHGAKRKKCNYPGCIKHVKKAGRCSAHGPPRQQCNMNGCTNVSVQGGRCISHGASKKQCCIKNCSKQSVLSGMCKKHHDEMIVGPLKEQALQGNVMTGVYGDGIVPVFDFTGSSTMACFESGKPRLKQALM